MTSEEKLEILKGLGCARVYYNLGASADFDYNSTSVYFRHYDGYEYYSTYDRFSWKSIEKILAYMESIVRIDKKSDSGYRPLWIQEEGFVDEKKKWIRVKYEDKVICVDNDSGAEYSEDRQAFLKCPKDIYGGFIIPDGVIKVGYKAFDWCQHLTSIVLPDTIRVIGTYAFNMCSSLNFINIPQGVKSIEYGAFYSCKNLIALVLPTSIDYIGNNLFYDTYNLKVIAVPTGEKERFLQMHGLAEFADIIVEIR